MWLELDMKPSCFLSSCLILAIAEIAFSQDPIPITELPQTPFYGVTRLGRRFTGYGEFTWLGTNIDTFVPLVGRVAEVAANAERTSFYGMGNHDVYELAFEPPAATHLTPQDTPDFEWTMGMSYDTTRDRLIVQTLSGEGFLWSFDPQGRTWSVLSSLKEDDLTAIAYFEPNDRIYGIGGPGGVFSFPINLYEFDSSGELLSRRPIEIPKPLSSPERSNQLVPVDNYLALIQYYSVDGVEQPRVFAIDPVTATTYTAVVPEPSMTWLLLLGLLSMIPLRTRNRVWSGTRNAKM